MYHYAYVRYGVSNGTRQVTDYINSMAAEGYTVENIEIYSGYFYVLVSKYTGEA